MELTRFTNKNALLNLVVILIALIIASNIYKTQNRQVESLKAKKENETKKNTVLEEISNLEKKINAYKTLLPKKDAGVIINNLTDIARQSGVKIGAIRPESEQSFTDYVKLPISLEISASDYHKFGKFISVVESYSDVYIVDSVNISSGSEKQGLLINLKLSAILYKD
jgi:Tfp pilus assembly protein PilO